MIKQLWNGLLDLLYPPKCALCTKLLSRNESDLCRDCRLDTERVLFPLVKGKSFECCHSVFYYKKDVAAAIKRLKFSGKRHLGQVFGRLLAMKLLGAGVTADVITWAPVSAKRKRKRGYDQGEEIAISVGKELGIPVVGLLKKTRHTSAQAQISDHDARKTNVTNAYIAVELQQIKGKRILLIDDVITSGATLTECSKTLKKAGAKSIICGTFAAAGS